jgi:hypothetical protein
VMERANHCRCCKCYHGFAEIIICRNRRDDAYVLSNQHILQLHAQVALISTTGLWLPAPSLERTQPSSETSSPLAPRSAIGMHPQTPSAKTTTILTSRSCQMPVANQAAEHRTEPLLPSAAAYTDAAGHGAKAAKKRGVQKLLMSAFKRVDHHDSVGASGSSTSTGGGSHT